MNVILDPPEECLHGECGHTEFVVRCEVCGRLANMAYQKVGPRGGVKKGYVIACSRLCGEPAARVGT